ncbi:MAG: type II toxin-antitoxin system HicA family toxin [Candidatus Micrarchaeota archaeon]
MSRREYVITEQGHPMFTNWRILAKRHNLPETIINELTERYMAGIKAMIDARGITAEIKGNTINCYLQEATRKPPISIRSIERLGKKYATRICKRMARELGVKPGSLASQAILLHAALKADATPKQANTLLDWYERTPGNKVLRNYLFAQAAQHPCILQEGIIDAVLNTARTCGIRRGELFDTTHALCCTQPAHKPPQRSRSYSPQEITELLRGIRDRRLPLALLTEAIKREVFLRPGEYFTAAAHVAKFGAAMLKKIPIPTAVGYLKLKAPSGALSEVHALAKTLGAERAVALARHGIVSEFAKEMDVEYPLEKGRCNRRLTIHELLALQTHGDIGAPTLKAILNAGITPNSLEFASAAALSRKNPGLPATRILASIRQPQLQTTPVTPANATSPKTTAPGRKQRTPQYQPPEGDAATPRPAAPKPLKATLLSPALLSPDPPAWKVRKMLSALGFTYMGRDGKHDIYTRDTGNGKLTVPLPGTDVKRYTLVSALAQGGVTPDEYEKAARKAGLARH